MVGWGQEQGGLEAVSEGRNKHLAAGAAAKLGDGLKKCVWIPECRVSRCLKNEASKSKG